MIELTRYELLDVAGTYHALGISALMANFSIMCAYLIAAYLVGAKLERTQVTIVSVLFVTASLGMTWATGAYLDIAQDFLIQSGQKLPITAIQPHEICVPIFLLGMVACLIFMLQVRHPKSD